MQLTRSECPGAAVCVKLNEPSHPLNQVRATRHVDLLPGGKNVLIGMGANLTLPPEDWCHSACREFNNEQEAALEVHRLRESSPGKLAYSLLVSQQAACSEPETQVIRVTPLDTALTERSVHDIILAPNSLLL